MSEYDKNIRTLENAGHFAFDVNTQDYQMIKCKKKIHNIKKSNIWKNCNNKVDDFVILPKTSYQNNMFNGQSSNYIDFELQQLPQHAYDKFILSFTITNQSTSDNAWLNLSPLFIDRVSLLVNSNVMGSDIDQYNILFHNLRRNGKIDGLGIDAAQNSLNYNLGFISQNWLSDTTFSQWGTAFASNTLYTNTSRQYKIELPISLAKSHFLSAGIKDNIVIRVYFKKSIIVLKPTSGFGNQVLDSQISISNLQLYLRCIELN